MSLPNIPNITPIIGINREEALTMILASIALEEMGLAHIINAESEKIRYVLNAGEQQAATLRDIKDVNQGAERIVRDVMKLQMLLQEKLEDVISLSPRPPDPPKPPDPPIPPKPPCPEPPKSKCNSVFALIGCAKGYVHKKCGLFRRGMVSIESDAYPVHSHDITELLKYKLYSDTGKDAVTALLVAIPDSTAIQYFNRLNSCPIVQKTRMLVMKGQGVFYIKGWKRECVQSKASFTLVVWDYGNHQKFQMIIYSSNEELNHDSGVISITSGNLEIKKKNELYSE